MTQNISQNDFCPNMENSKKYYFLTIFHHNSFIIDLMQISYCRLPTAFVVGCHICSHLHSHYAWGIMLDMMTLTFTFIFKVNRLFGVFKLCTEVQYLNLYHRSISLGAWMSSVSDDLDLFFKVMG
jgi:hypothetical protein